ncbi:PTS glucose transporter subunit IIA [Kineothrix sedimenti]|uniref:PTS glucose transporter subunit IIA n=1 Tax=Kineothrix sedimenti TaxID=3123317 RepID=A0ABZ3EQF5_9FIRM
MGLFDAFKKKDVVISSPMKGRCVSIKAVSDPTFSEEILGKGVAIVPKDGKVYAPADGVITTIFPTGHAVGMTTNDGVELLIHVGLDTVALKGEGFRIIGKDEQKVKKGDLLIEADLEKIKSAGYDVITPVVVCNTDEYSEILGRTDTEVNAGDELLNIKK